MENDTDVSLWGTKQSDMTVGDSVKVAVAVTVVTTAVAFAVIAGAGAIGRLAEKYQARKTAKLEVVN